MRFHSRADCLEQFRVSGFVVLPAFTAPPRLATLNEVARAQLEARTGALEFEADLQYPGAPASRSAPGGDTVRRLLDAYSRDAAFRDFATTPALRECLESYFGEGAMLSLAHHNCIMTKHPLYGTETGWHRDMRFWSFAHEDLVSVWLALGEETVDNGGLWFVPGSHAMRFDADRFDAAQLFRTDRTDNADLVRRAESPRLMPGDAVFFHCKTLHSARQNSTRAVKYSLVYTFHGVSNPPRPGTRSAAKPEINLRSPSVP